MKKDPYATAEESASVMAKGLTTKRIAAINHVLLMMDARDTYEMCATPEYQIKELYEVAYDLAEQRAELLGVLKDMYTAASGGVKTCGHDFHCTCPYDEALVTITKCEAAQ